MYPSVIKWLLMTEIVKNAHKYQIQKTDVYSVIDVPTSAAYLGHQPFLSYHAVFMMLMGPKIVFIEHTLVFLVNTFRS